MRGGGEMVQVEGGHIVRSTGGKDRHSKVCTAKGLRDRRVRLSAHTAIQFYDVQDRLGYDRPSKAVDWLINKAKAAIDQLPPTVTPPPTSLIQQQQNDTVFASRTVSENNNNKYNSGGSASGFLPLDTDIADTIKSFFPTTSFQNYPPPPDLLSRTASNNYHQDLRLSLQSFQDPILLHHHQHAHEQVLFAGTTTMGFDGGSSGWSEQQEQGRLQRMVAWNNADAGFAFNAAAAAPMFGGHGQYFSSQRGPLQSSNTPSIRAWTDDPSSAMTVDHQHYLSPAAIGFAAPSSGGFSGFRVPARIQGEEEHDGLSVKSSSASSDSRH